MLKPLARLSFVIACCFLLLEGSLASATDNAASFVAIPTCEDYVLRSWEMDDGLPNNSVTGIAQSPEGYLWLATPGGLTRFDGVRFCSYPKESNPELESNSIRSVFVSREGELWVGLEKGGVARRQHTRFEIVAPMEGPIVSTAWVSSFSEDASGAIWFGMASIAKAERWQAGKLTEFTKREGIAPGVETYVATDRAGKVWFWTKNGCGFFNGTGFREIDPEGGIHLRLTPARKGGMWAARNQKLIRYDSEGNREEISDLSWLGDPNAVTVLFEDHQGDLWIGTRSWGLYRFRQGAYARVPTSHSTIACITEDRQGNLWVGTEGGGLDRLNRRSFFLRQTKDGLQHDYIISICEEASGKLWLAGRMGVPVRSLDESNRSFEALTGWPGGQVLAICPDPRGGIHVATLGRGILKFEDGQFKPETWANATALLVDHNGVLWAAPLKQGLICRSGTTLYHMPEKEGLVEPRALAEDPKGRLWVGTEQGLLFVLENQRFIRVPLPTSDSREQVLFIVPDGKETVWVGTKEGSLYRVRGGKSDRLSSKTGFPTTQLRSMLIDPSGHKFWFGTGRGLLRVDRGELEAAMNGKSASVRFVAFGRDDGLSNIEFSVGFRNGASKTRDGHLWFGTWRGALEVVPETLPKQVEREQVIIESVETAEGPVPASMAGSFVLPPRPGPVTIRFTLPEMRSPEQVRFRYRLTSLGEVWNEAQRSVTFAHLPPGKHRFEVAASVAGEPWLAETAMALVIVKAAWWETIYFRVGVALAMAGAVGSIVLWAGRRRMRARIAVLEQERALERERTRIARDMHDELGASLTQIAIASKFAEEEASEPVASQVHEIADIARVASDALDEIVWAVNPRYDKLSSLIEYLGKFASEFLNAAGIVCEMDIPANPPALALASNVRHHLFLVTKESLNNLVKYSGAKKARLEIALGKGFLRIEVADNGRGFEPGKESSDSNGLRNMRERMAELGGNCRIESSPGMGTRVSFELPL